MPARASFSFDEGITQSSWNATFALRMRVSMSAIGSVIVMASPPHHDALVTPGTSPACDSSRRQIRHRPNFRYTERALPQRRHRVYVRTLNFGLRCCFSINAFFANALPLRLAGTTERETEHPQERTAFIIGAGTRGDGDVHPPHRIDLVVVDLREDQLLGDAECVVAPTVERVGVHAAEVTDARDRDTDEAVVELPHPIAPQRDLRADGVDGPELEAGNRLLGPCDGGLPTRDDGEVVHRAVEQRRLLGRPADAAVQHDLLESGDLHRVGKTEVRLELPAQLFVVPPLEPGRLVHLNGCRHQTSPPHFRQTRTFLPSSSNRYPTRVGPQLGHASATFEMSIGMSLSMMPPCIVARVAF